MLRAQVKADQNNRIQSIVKVNVGYFRSGFFCRLNANWFDYGIL
jgi:hypothetical protein